MKHNQYPLVIGGIKKTEYGITKYHIPEEEQLDYKGIIEYIVDARKMYYMNTVWAKLYRTDIIISNNIRFNDFKFGEDTCFIYEYVKHIDEMYVVGENVYNVVAMDNSMSIRKVENSWNIMKKIYENGSQLIDVHDTRSRFLLLNRSLKQTMILQSRYSYTVFRKCCNEMRLYIKDVSLPLNEIIMDVYQKLIVYGLINQRYLFLFCFFKIRRWSNCIVKKG